MLLCLGGSQADVTFAMSDKCHAWDRENHFAFDLLPHASVSYEHPQHYGRGSWQWCFSMLSSLRSLLEDYISPLSVKLRGGGGCFWVVSLYILMYHSFYRVALAQENKRILLGLLGCLICKTILMWKLTLHAVWGTLFSRSLGFCVLVLQDMNAPSQIGASERTFWSWYPDRPAGSCWKGHPSETLELFKQICGQSFLAVPGEKTKECSFGPPPKQFFFSTSQAERIWILRPWRLRWNRWGGIPEGRGSPFLGTGFSWTGP